MICTNSETVGMCLCVILAASNLLYCWMDAYFTVLCICCASMQIFYTFGCIYDLVHIILYYYKVEKPHFQLLLSVNFVFPFLVCNAYCCLLIDISSNYTFVTES